jgi:hypothetical protein
VQEGELAMTLDDFKAQMLREEGLLGKDQHFFSISLQLQRFFPAFCGAILLFVTLHACPYFLFEISF